jgi:hypothetical protein
MCSVVANKQGSANVVAYMGEQPATHKDVVIKQVLRCLNVSLPYIPQAHATSLTSKK